MIPHPTGTCETTDENLFRILAHLIQPLEDAPQEGRKDPYQFTKLRDQALLR